VIQDGGQDYETWRRSLVGEPEELDGMADDRHLPAGFNEFALEVFRDRGPISSIEFDQAHDARQLLLARRAVELVETDVQRTAGIEMRFDVGIKTINDDFEIVVVSYRGSYQTPVIFALRQPEATAEVADNMQDLIVKELHSAWPVCPSHDRGLYAMVDEGNAVWYCRSGTHSATRIGEYGLQR
jgi:hypothetical protein